MPKWIIFSKLILNISSISCNLASKIMTLAFAFLPFVFMNLLREIFFFIKNLSYDNCRDKPMSTLNQLFSDLLNFWVAYLVWNIALWNSATKIIQNGIKTKLTSQVNNTKNKLGFCIQAHCETEPQYIQNQWCELF